MRKEANPNLSWPVYTSSEQQEKEQVEAVFHLGGGELEDESFAGYKYNYDGMPEYADIGEDPDYSYHTVIATGGGLLSPPKKTLEDDGVVWELVETYTSSGETDCPVCGAGGNGVEWWAEQFEDAHGRAPTPNDECGLCENLYSEMPGFVYIGDGYEAIYRTHNSNIWPEDYEDEREAGFERSAMDPNALLQNILDLAEYFLFGRAADEPFDETQVEELAEGVTNLNEWIERGGFLPDKWNKGPKFRAKREGRQKDARNRIHRGDPVDRYAGRLNQMNELLSIERNKRLLRGAPKWVEQVLPRALQLATDARTEARLRSDQNLEWSGVAAELAMTEARQLKPMSEEEKIEQVAAWLVRMVARQEGRQKDAAGKKRMRLKERGGFSRSDMVEFMLGDQIAYGKIIDFKRQEGGPVALISVKSVMDNEGVWSRYPGGYHKFVPIPINELETASRPFSWFKEQKAAQFTGRLRGAAQEPLYIRLFRDAVDQLGAAGSKDEAVQVLTYLVGKAEELLQELQTVASTRLAGPSYYWLQVGDQPDYDKFDSLPDVITELQKAGVGPVRAWTKLGLETSQFQGDNDISLYIGDEAANPYHELKTLDKIEVNRALGLEDAPTTASRKGRRAAAELDTFTEAYVVAALWSSLDEDGVPLDDNYSIDDIDADCLAKMVTDCQKFQQDNWADFVEVDDVSAEYMNEEVAGHDFWLTRNKHGTGFWDGDWPEPQATRLSDAAEAFGETDLYVTDDDTLACT